MEKSYEYVLNKVIIGLKLGDPVIYTLKKLNYRSFKFYKNTDKLTLKYFDEIRFLKSDAYIYGAVLFDPCANKNICEHDLKQQNHCTPYSH